MISTEINSPAGKTYLARLKALCETSGQLPTQLILSGELGDLETEPVNSSSSANVHKGSYKGCEVAVRVLKVRSQQSSEATHKVRMRRCVCIFGLPAGFLSGWSRRWLSGHASGTKTSCRSLGSLRSHPGSLSSPNGCPLVIS